MEELIENILANKIYTIIAVIILLAIIFFIVKRLLKLLFYAVIIFAAFLAYVHFTGGNVEEVINKTKDEGEKIIIKGKESIEKSKNN